jgi:predicted dehydrogenase
MVGFNRRYAPHTEHVKQLLAGRAQPVAISVMVNAGDIPANSWVQSAEQGGGRMIGEGCHFIDLAMYLVGQPIIRVYADMFGPKAGAIRDDKMSVSLGFADGSMATVHYWANGPKSFPKERIDVFSEGRALTIDNWRRILAYSWPGARSMRMRQDKGHKAEVAAFLQRVGQGGPPLIPFHEADRVTLASFAAVRSAREGVPVRLESAP